MCFHWQPLIWKYKPKTNRDVEHTEAAFTLKYFIFLSRLKTGLHLWVTCCWSQWLLMSHSPVWTWPTNIKAWKLNAVHLLFGDWTKFFFFFWHCMHQCLLSTPCVPGKYIILEACFVSEIKYSVRNPCNMSVCSKWVVAVGGSLFAL